MRDAIDADVAGAGRDDATQDFHQRALAGPVLADQAQHLTGVQVQGHAIERDHAWIGLTDPHQLEPVLHPTPPKWLPLLRQPRYFANKAFIAAWNSATLVLSITLVGMMICLLAGMNAVSPRSTLSMSIMDW